MLRNDSDDEQEEDETFLDDGLAFDIIDEIKPKRSNAKAVECRDENNKLIGTYRSGVEAAAAMGVLHGEVSLACRGLKENVKGYKFAFAETDPRSLATDGEIETLQSSRASKYRMQQGEFELSGKKYKVSKNFSLGGPPPRKWEKIRQENHRLMVLKWVPQTAVTTQN
jgi:hypothetical protein